MLINETNVHLAEEFIRLKLEMYDTAKLQLYFKWSKGRNNID
jgi:hypothetical protein